MTMTVRRGPLATRNGSFRHHDNDLESPLAQVPTDIGWITRVWEYLSAIGLYWWGALAVLTALERYSDRLIPEKWKPTADNWIAPIFAFCVANFMAFDEENNRLRAVQAGSGSAQYILKYRWPPLSEEEAQLLRAKLLHIQKPPSIRIICNDRDCRELAESLFDILKNLQWSVSSPVYGAGIPSSRNPTGILMLQNDENDRRLADAIEMSTKGRLKVTTQKESDPQVTIAIGYKPAD
jgi:hypothetical protein